MNTWLLFLLIVELAFGVLLTACSVSFTYHWLLHDCRHPADGWRAVFCGVYAVIVYWVFTLTLELL